MSCNDLLGVYIFRWGATRSHLLWDVTDLSNFNFFQRSTVRDMMLFHTRVVVERAAVGESTSVTLEQGVGICHVLNHHTGLAAAAVTRPAYPNMVVHQLLADVLRAYHRENEGNYDGITEDTTKAFAQGSQLFTKYKDPLEVDKLSQINKELEAVKGIMFQNLEDILQRGEQMEALMEKTGDLSEASKQFYKTAKSNNQCCNVGL